MESATCPRNWLRNHVRHFVVPCLHALRYDPKGELTTLRDVDFEKQRRLRPAKGYFSPEAGLVASALKSFGVTSEDGDWILRTCEPSRWDTRHRYSDEAALELGLDLEFLGKFGYENVEMASDPRNRRWLARHSFAKNAFRALASAAAGRTLILPGRDVWVFEIHARRAGYPSVYDPRLSRLVSHRRPLLRKIVESWQVVDFDRAFVFDTGFAGSIACALRDVIGPNLKDLMLSTDRKVWNRRRARTESLQLFPYHYGSRRKALDIEYTPKYFRSGTVREGKVVQRLAPLDEFVRAAAMTIWWWRVQSPRFVPCPKEAPGRMLDSPPPKVTANSGGFVSNTLPALTVGTMPTNHQWVSATTMPVSGATAGTAPEFWTWASSDTTSSTDWAIDMTGLTVDG